MVKAFHRSLEAKLATLKDPEYDESDDDENEDDQPQTTISSKRTAAGKGTKRKKKQSTKDNDDDDESPSTVIYLGHLPVGFEEREITTFLNQFGSVKRCRVSRSTKTGRSRGYAFVDFIDPEVTQIVAETMSGYFLLEKRLVCHILPNDKVHELMFAKPKKVPTKAEKQKKARLEVNQRRSADVMKEITAKLVKREEMKRKKLVELGIDYEFPGYKASAEVVAGSSSSSSAAAGDKSNKKKKRKLSGDANEEVVKDDTHTNNNEAEKTPKSQKKSSKKKKRASSVDQEEEKENDADAAAAAVTEEEPPSKKKKKSGKTPKKQKTPKNK